jgi:bifunctional non-homologous end joining protein LigD
MASLGCIEINPWFSRVSSPDNPDFCVIDLDPDKQHFDQVISAAQEVKKVLDAIGVTAYPKTSGSTGMHIYIPLGAKYTYDQSPDVRQDHCDFGPQADPGVHQPGAHGQEPWRQDVP